ncbi:hypothetical protein [Bordetella genomosp. 11]|uniref:Uncharacterized protein n=1 Tax=Bordetella genomosp. 11 TaxID=1416808 RepID=A0A261UDA9_9BORD|nr:hypothetical protein [Bordetella genomosp. 11]OZI59908.1 hypothetical protein CAL28_10485 [Bordetella genomosp. 11]
MTHPNPEQQWKMAPVEPTQEMLEAAYLPNAYRKDSRTIYRAMIDATPPAPAEPQAVGHVFTMEALTPGGGMKCHAALHRDLPSGTLLYLAPPPQQPAQGWQDIATVSEGNLVVVYWEDPTDPANPERYDFDYLEDGTWMNHHDRYEHMLIAGAHGLKEKAPYTHWMALGKPGINFALGTEPAQGQDAKEPERFVVLKASGSRYAYVNDTLLGKTVKRYDILRGGWINAELHAARLNRDVAMTAAQGDVVQGGGK